VRPRWFALLLLAGLAVRVAALPLPGTEDVNVWKVWSFNAAQDVTAVYGIGGDPPVRRLLEYHRQFTPVDYPPIGLYVLGIVGRIYGALAPGYPNTWPLVAAIKIPGLCAGMALTWLFYAVVRRATGSREAARAAALSYWLNPATILNGEVLGYLDPLVMLPVIAAFVLVHRREGEWGGACLSIALLTKPQAVLVLPAFALAAWRTLDWRGRIGTAIAGAIAIGLGVLPYALVGALPNMWIAFGSFYARRDILSGNAANIWWIANWLSRASHMVADQGWHAFFVPVARIMAISTFVEQGLPNPRPFASAAILLVAGWAAWRVRHARSLAIHAALGAFTVHAFFVLGVGVHEHHQMLAVPLLALAAALCPGFRAIFVTVSLICALNMNLFYGISRGWGWAVPRMITPIDLSVLLSFANLAALVWHARVLMRETARAEAAGVAVARAELASAKLPGIEAASV
jgi:hypothetical protein